jgi:hypothetical protein
LSNCWRYPKVRALILLGQEPLWLTLHPRADYVRLAILATPPWVSRADLLAPYNERLPGEVIDHIVPLKHSRVCGLNVPWNMQRLSTRANQVKRNHWCPEQMALQL